MTFITSRLAPIIANIAIGLFVLCNNSYSQISKSKIDTVYQNLGGECFVTTSYIVKIKHFLLYLPDTVYEKYSIDYSNTNNFAQLTKGSISSLPGENVKLNMLVSLLTEKHEFCYVYNLKSK